MKTYEYRTLTFDIGSAHHASAKHQDWLNKNCANWEIIDIKHADDGIDYTMRRELVKLWKEGELWQEIFEAS